MTPIFCGMSFKYPDPPECFLPIKIRILCTPRSQGHPWLSGSRILPSPMTGIAQGVTRHEYESGEQLFKDLNEIGGELASPCSYSQKGEKLRKDRFSFASLRWVKSNSIISVPNRTVKVPLSQDGV